MSADLSTTNTWLAIMAAVSVLEALLILGLGVAAFVGYRRLTSLLDDLDGRRIHPIATRVIGVLDDLKVVTGTIRGETERLDSAIRSTIDRVDDTADRVRNNVRAKASRFFGLVRGARIALETILSREPPRAA
jgi:hypothetical protein